MADNHAPARTLKDIISAYRAIERENEMGRDEWEKFRQNPFFDAFVEEMYGGKGWGLRSDEEYEEDKLRAQWGRLCDAVRKRKQEAFAMFTPEEQAMLDRYTGKLLS